MFVRSPSEFYLKYLVTHPDGLTTAAVRAHMHSRRLYPGPDGYIDALRTRLFPPKPFFPSRPKHKPSSDFLIEEGIYGLWHQNEHTKMAMSLLEQALPQEAAHAMLSVGSPPESTALLLDKRFGLPFSTQAVERYKKYFWNTDLVSRAELGQICAALAGTPQKFDPVLNAARLPATPMSAVVVQIRLGFIPEKLNQYEALKKCTEACTYRMYEALMTGGKEGAEIFRNLSWGQKFTFDAMSTMAAPENDLKKMISSIELVTKATKPPTIDEVTGGNVSDGSFADDPNKQESAKTKKAKVKK